MEEKTFVALLLGVAILNFSSIARCQQTGKHDYQTLCAACHGLTGTGQGRDLVEANPPDLTQLS